MQSLCTFRNRCRQRSRNTRYQADATPYLSRTSTGWIAPALPGALIRSPRQRARAAVAAPEAERLGDREIDGELEVGRLPCDPSGRRSCACNGGDDTTL